MFMSGDRKSRGRKWEKTSLSLPFHALPPSRSHGSSVSELAVDEVLQPLAGEEALEVREPEVEERRDIPRIVAGDVGRDDEIGRGPQRRFRRQWLGIEYVEHGTRQLALHELLTQG